MAMQAGSVVLDRTSVWRDRMRKYKVMIDGVEAGDIKAGEEKTFPVNPGEHQLQMNLDWTSSPPLRFRLEPGENVRFLCGGGKTWTMLVDQFKPKTWIKLDRVDS